MNLMINTSQTHKKQPITRNKKKDKINGNSKRKKYNESVLCVFIYKASRRVNLLVFQHSKHPGAPNLPFTVEQPSKYLNSYAIACCKQDIPIVWIQPWTGQDNLENTYRVLTNICSVTFLNESKYKKYSSW